LVTITTYQNKKTIKEVGSSSTRSIFHCETINVVTFQFKLLSSMRIHHVFHVSLLEPYDHAHTILEIIHNPLPHIEIDNKKKNEMEDILELRILIVNSNILFINMNMI